eukprot:scaffold1163_cov362-Prasinococcus_capsulatus_cf.AAC.13
MRRSRVSEVEQHGHSGGLTGSQSPYICYRPAHPADPPGSLSELHRRDEGERKARYFGDHACQSTMCHVWSLLATTGHPPHGQAPLLLLQRGRCGGCVVGGVRAAAADAAALNGRARRERGVTNNNVRRSPRIADPRPP